MNKYRLTIHCTKEHLEKAKYCSLDTRKHYNKKEGFSSVASNCWIAVACQDIFPLCNVSSVIDNNMRYFMNIDKEEWTIQLPQIAKDKIEEFDDCKTVEEREKLKPFSFDVTIDQRTFETILECNGFSSQQFSNICKKEQHLEFSEV